MATNAMAALALSLSCVKFASELDSNESNGLALEAGQGSDADWSCLTQSTPVDTPRALRELTFSFVVQDFVTSAPVRDASVRACFSADLACVTPATDPSSSSAAGRVAVTAPQGFDGYLEIKGEGMIATLMFFAAPWSEQLLDLLEANPVLLFPAPALQAYADLAPAVIGPGTGGIGVLANDCAGVAAAGVRLDIDSEGVPVAFVDGLPVAQDFTSTDGLGGFGQVPPGVVVLKAFLEDRAEPIAVESLLVRSGWFTIVTLVPRVQ